MDVRVRFILCALSFALLAACSGDAGIPDVQGTWSGTLTPNDGGPGFAVTAAIIDGGPGFIYDNGGFFAVNGLRSQNPLTGAMRRMDVSIGAGLCPMGVDCTNLFALYGTGYKNSLQLGARDGRGLPGIPDPDAPVLFAFQLDRSLPYDGNITNAVMIYAGSWQGYYLPGNTAVALTVDQAGNIAGSDGFGCSLKGQLAQVGWPTVFSSTTRPDPKNLFSLKLDGAMGINSGICGVSLIGVGYLSSTGTGPFANVPGTYFFMGLYNPDAFSEVLTFDYDTGYMLELKVR